MSLGLDLSFRIERTGVVVVFLIYWKKLVWFIVSTLKKQLCFYLNDIWMMVLNTVQTCKETKLCQTNKLFVLQQPMDYFLYIYYFTDINRGPFLKYFFLLSVL